MKILLLVFKAEKELSSNLSQKHGKNKQATKQKMYIYKVNFKLNVFRIISELKDIF